MISSFLLVGLYFCSIAPISVKGSCAETPNGVLDSSIVKLSSIAAKKVSAPINFIFYYLKFGQLLFIEKNIDGPVRIQHFNWYIGIY